MLSGNVIDVDELNHTNLTVAKEQHIPLLNQDHALNGHRKRPLIYQYKPSEQADEILAQWHARLLAEGEFDKVLGVRLKPLGQFMCFFYSHPLFVQVDEFGSIHRAGWFDGFMDGIFLAFWTSRAARKDGRETLRFLFDMVGIGLTAGQVVMGAIQERSSPAETQKFIRQHERLGYQLIGHVPYIFDGATAYFMMITKESWEHHKKVFHRILGE